MAAGSEKIVRINRQMAPEGSKSNMVILLQTLLLLLKAPPYSYQVPSTLALLRTTVSPPSFPCPSSSSQSPPLLLLSASDSTQ